MKKFRKLLNVTLSIMLALGMIMGCGQAEEGTPHTDGEDTTTEEKTSEAGTTLTDTGTESSVEEDDIYDGIEPLSAPVDLNFGTLTGSHHGMVIYMIERLGGFEKVGINANIESFGNGPVMVEALSSDSWDCGTIGLGGVLSGVITQDMLIIGAAARDCNSLRIFAKNDSDIVSAGETLADYPGIYGTAETWKGKEILIPTGSTLHYVLATGLDKFGLSDSDVAMTHMDVPSVNTALRAGKGEIGALWGSFAYADDINENFTIVMSADDLDIQLPVVMCANPRSYADSEKYEAIKKWMELYFATVDWIYSNEENFSKAVEMFTEINEETGATGTIEENRTVLEGDRYYTLEENVALFNNMSDDGKMLEIEQMHYDPLMFYIKNGSYQLGDEDKFLGGYFKADIINELAEMKKR